NARFAALPPFHQPWRPVAARGPQPATLPTRIGIVDAPIEPLGIKTQGIGNAQHDHRAVLERNQAIIEIASRHRHVLAEAKGIVLIDPGIVTRFRAVLADPLKARTWILVERPTFLAMIARGGWTVQRPLALTPVEAADVAASQRHPDNALFVDVASARSKPRRRNVVNLGQSRRGRIGPGIEPQYRSTTGEHADRITNRAVDPTGHHRMGA